MGLHVVNGAKGQPVTMARQKILICTLMSVNIIEKSITIT